MTNTPDPIAHAARLLREAAQELKQAHTIGGSAEWDGTEPEVQAVYDEHMAAAAAIEEWERAVGAGGVEPLRKPAAQPSRECLQQSASAARDPAVEKPAAGRYVLAWVEGATVPIRAMWVPAMWLEADDECAEDWAEYDEAKDEYFCPEGWYEKNEHEEKNWSVSTPIVAWMELPRLTAALQAAPPAPEAVAVPADVEMALARMDQRLTHGLIKLTIDDDSFSAQAARLDMATIRAALAAAPAQEHATQLAGQDAEPAAWLATYLDRKGNEAWYVTTRHDLAVENDARGQPVALYRAAPVQAQEDARDAARYRHARAGDGHIKLVNTGGKHNPALWLDLEDEPADWAIDAEIAIDAARAAQGDRNV